MAERLCVAAIQMDAATADVAGNLARAERLVEAAFAKGARWVALPEFFTTAMAFDERMLGASLPLDGRALAMMRTLAARHRGFVGGSFICSQRGERYNTYAVVGPDGTHVTHDKDIPTFWEGCYYRGGSDDGVHELGGLRLGLAVCAEFWRRQTAARLRERVDLVIGGSAWWGVPKWPILRGWLGVQQGLLIDVVRTCLPKMARLVGAPIVHGGHCAAFRTGIPRLPFLPYETSFLAETAIVDADGTVLARMGPEDGEGVIVATIEPRRVPPADGLQEPYWLFPTTPVFDLMWKHFNRHAARYYARHRHVMKDAASWPV